jgi:hypothetical protein
VAWAGVCCEQWLAEGRVSFWYFGCNLFIFGYKKSRSGYMCFVKVSELCHLCAGACQII